MTAQEVLAQVRAEIEKRQCKAEYEKMQCQGISAISYNMHLAEENAYLFLLDFLDSIQVEEPEVDIWKEIHKYFNPHGMKLQFDRSKGNTILMPEQLFNFARHFYELGRARKDD